VRILHVIPHYYPAVRYGGPIRSVHGLAAATGALGHEVHVYTTNVDGPGVSDVPTGAPVERDGVSVWYFPAGFGRKVFRSPAMDRMLDQAVRNFDIVHIHYVWVWPTVAAARAARRHRVPYVLSPRGMLVEDLIRRKSQIAKRTWLMLFDRRNVEAAAAVHVTAESEAAELRALGLKPRRIEVIPNGIDMPGNTGIAAGAPASATSQVGSAPYVLFLGRISWKKGLDRLISAIAVVEGVDLVIAGYDENNYQASAERLVAQAGLRARVRFIGPVDGDAKWALIRAASCLVLPSYNENFGMAVIEGMAAGCPVVVTEEVGLAGMVAKTGCGLVAYGGAAELAAALASVLSDGDRRRAMGEAGLRTVREHFGWPGIARAMEQLYVSCAGSRTAKAARGGMMSVPSDTALP
jgi:glycosyltransferase involved in cell wall biosynthesis